MAVASVVADAAAAAPIRRGIVSVCSKLAACFRCEESSLVDLGPVAVTLCSAQTTSSSSSSSSGSALEQFELAVEAAGSDLSSGMASQPQVEAEVAANSFGVSILVDDAGDDVCNDKGANSGTSLVAFNRELCGLHGVSRKLLRARARFQRARDVRHQRRLSRQETVLRQNRRRKEREKRCRRRELRAITSTLGREATAPRRRGKSGVRSSRSFACATPSTPALAARCASRGTCLRTFCPCMSSLKQRVVPIVALPSTWKRVPGRSFSVAGRRFRVTRRRFCVLGKYRLVRASILRKIRRSGRLLRRRCREDRDTFEKQLRKKNGTRVHSENRQEAAALRGADFCIPYTAGGLSESSLGSNTSEGCSISCQGECVRFDDEFACVRVGDSADVAVSHAEATRSLSDFAIGAELDGVLDTSESSVPVGNWCPVSRSQRHRPLTSAYSRCGGAASGMCAHASFVQGGYSRDSLACEYVHAPVDLTKLKVENVDADLLSLRHAGASVNSVDQGDNDVDACCFEHGKVNAPLSSAEAVIASQCSSLTECSNCSCNDVLLGCGRKRKNKYVEYVEDDDATWLECLVEKYSMGYDNAEHRAGYVLDLVSLAMSANRDEARRVFVGMFGCLKWRLWRGSQRLTKNQMADKLRHVILGSQLAFQRRSWETWESDIVSDPCTKQDMRARLVQFLRAYISDSQMQSRDAVFRHLSGDSEAESDGPWRLWHFFDHTLRVSMLKHKKSKTLFAVHELRSRFDAVIDLVIDTFPALLVVLPTASLTWEQVLLDRARIDAAKHELELFLGIDLATIDHKQLVDKLEQEFPSGKKFEQRLRDVFTDVLGVTVSMSSSSGSVPDQVLRLWLSSLLDFDGLALPPGTLSTWEELSAFPAWREHAKRELMRHFGVDGLFCDAGVVIQAVKRGLEAAETAKPLWVLFQHTLRVLLHIDTAAVHLVFSERVLRQQLADLLELDPVLLAVLPAASLTGEQYHPDSTWINEAKQKLECFLQIDLVTIDRKRLVEKIEQTFPSYRSAYKMDEQRLRDVFTDVLGLTVSTSSSSGSVPDQVLRLWLSSLLDFDGVALPPGTLATWEELGAFPAWREHAVQELGRHFRVDANLCGAGVLVETVKRGLEAGQTAVNCQKVLRDLFRKTLRVRINSHVNCTSKDRVISDHDLRQRLADLLGLDSLPWSGPRSKRSLSAVHRENIDACAAHFVARGTLPRRVLGEKDKSGWTLEQLEEHRLALFLKNARVGIAKGLWLDADLQYFEEKLPAFWRLYGARAEEVAFEALVLGAEQEADDFDTCTDVPCTDTKDAVCVNMPVSSLSVDVITEVENCAYDFTQRCLANGLKVNDALFVDLWSNPHVSCAMTENARRRGLKGRSLAEQKAEVRAYVRWELLTNSPHMEVSDFADGFFCEQVRGVHRSLLPESPHGQCELRDMDVYGLIRVATGRVCGGLNCRQGQPCGTGACESAPRRLVASQWLRRYFPIQAKAFALSKMLPHGNSHNDDCRGDTDGVPDVSLGWQDFFRQLEEAACVEGVMRKKRVCCRDVLVRLHLRPDGRPQPFRPLVLPMFDAQGRRDLIPENVRRKRHASLTDFSVHGSEIVSLPSDFLCVNCASEFRQASAEKVKADVSLWREKMHMCPSLESQHVLAERAALLIRDDLLELARLDDPNEKTNSREAFWKMLSDHRVVLGHDRCNTVLEKDTRHSLDPSEYWKEPMADYCITTRRVFGLLWRKDKMHCSAVQRDEEGAGRWSDYTGRPGLVEEQVWRWRLWACARGGFQALRPSERSDMELAEGTSDPGFLRVQRSRGLFEYALDLKPQGHVPSLHIWGGVLLRVENDASRVALVRRKADEERHCWGISWKRIRYEVDVGLALAQAHRSKLLESSDLQVFLDCEAHASRNAGVYPRQIMLGAGENYRYDHVRQREAALARNAEKIAVRVASSRLASWRCRSESDWLALAGDCRNSSVADSPAPHVLAGEDICGGACDGFGMTLSSSAVVLDFPGGSFLFDSIRLYKELRLYKAP